MWPFCCMRSKPLFACIVIKGDSLSYHLGMRFTTKDRDNDKYYNNCGVKEMGGYWYNTCSKSNPNGHYFEGGNAVVAGKKVESGIIWNSLRGMYYSMKHIIMLIKPYEE